MKRIALAGLAIAALTFAPRAAADLPGIDPFTGSWHAHASGLTIDSDGSARLTYADISACPSGCAGHDDYADAPQATVDFTLTAVWVTPPPEASTPPRIRAMTPWASR
jgi:hypothetical protein